MTARHTPQSYRILVQGQLDERWAKWFEGLTVSPRPGGETELRGTLQDQASLHGALNRIRDLGLELISVTRYELGAENTNPPSCGGEAHEDPGL